MNFQERKHDSADNLIIRARLNHNYCKLIDSFLYLQKKLWQLLHLIYFGGELKTRFLMVCLFFHLIDIF